MLLKADKIPNLCSDVNVKFRNYPPHDKQLQEGKLAPPKLPKFEDPVATEPPVEDKKEDPFLNIAPKSRSGILEGMYRRNLISLKNAHRRPSFKL
ncbi:putative mRNA splicing factor Cwf18 [Helianthus annuus]|nr:putative mRNA splicing factor Cwf18 [Helianthus annuus]